MIDNDKIVNKIHNGNNKNIIIKDNKMKKKRKNIKQGLAKKKYTSPRSDTFLNKSQSLQAVGYSKEYAETKGQKILEDIGITDINLHEFNTFINDIPDLSLIIRRKIKQLKKGDIKAKDYANIIRHIELLAKFAGIIKNITENKSINVNIDIPISKCPSCGHIMDIMRE